MLTVIDVWPIRVDKATLLPRERFDLLFNLDHFKLNCAGDG